MTVLSQMHKALYKMNIGTDFVFPDSANLSDYKVIVVPPLYWRAMKSSSGYPITSAAADTW